MSNLINFSSKELHHPDDEDIKDVDKVKTEIVNCESISEETIEQTLHNTLLNKFVGKIHPDKEYK